MEDIVFQNVNIYFNLAFDLGEPVNPLDAARNLLKADFAGGLINYTTGESEIAEDFKESTEEYNRFLNAKKTLDELYENPTWSSYIKLILSNPLKYGPIYFNAFRSSGEKVEEAEEENSERDHADKVETKVDEEIPNNARVNNSKSSSVEDEESLESILEEVQDSVADFVLTLLGRLVIYASVDHTVFHEDYLEKVPFVRVSLQPFSIFWNDQEVSFDVIVTIQRSGIAILTCHGFFPANLGIQDVITLRRHAFLNFDACEIPATILGRYYELMYEDYNKIEMNQFIREFSATDKEGYLRFEVDEETVLAGFFDAYRYAIMENIQGKKHKSLDSIHHSLRSNIYFGYPIVFLNYPDTKDALKKENAELLAKLIMGFTSKSTLRSNVVKDILDKDLSATDETSLYLTEGSALIIDYREYEEDFSNSAEWIYESFMTTVPFDILLFQKAILGIYERQLEGITLDATGLDQLYKIKRELLLGLDEYHILGLSHYGSIQDDIKRGQDYLRIKESYDIFNQRLTSVDSLVQLAEGKRQGNREKFTRNITVIISALLSLTVAYDIVSIIAGWSTTLSRSYPPILEAPFIFLIRQIQTRPTASTIILYIVIFGATLITLFGNTLRLRKTQTAIPKTKPEKSSPKSLAPMHLTIRHSDEVEKEERER